MTSIEMCRAEPGPAEVEAEKATQPQWGETSSLVDVTLNLWRVGNTNGSTKQAWGQ